LRLYQIEQELAFAEPMISGRMMPDLVKPANELQQNGAIWNPESAANAPRVGLPAASGVH